ncbi:PepSY-associated TM helix domain-containing protein, partial [Acinetobacter baumannii]
MRQLQSWHWISAAVSMIGLLLFVLGLTGTVLVFKDDWLRLVVPHAAEARVSDPSAIGA